ncbi:fluoride efflux transporter CrcB [Lysinibacillus sp. 54212]|uniref:fluoride efflux transporter CrcB n=1 Tax=Lysinibacillus sp. 54212 TaxID=3119829 RepID=UPI002FCBC2BC
MNIIAVGIGGAFGALLRAFLGELIPYSGGFPYATFLCNCIGSFLLGFILTSQSIITSSVLKLSITTGVLGAFTTFSTFSSEVVTLIQAGNYIIATLYVSLSILAGLSLSLLGVKLTKVGERK